MVKTLTIEGMMCPRCEAHVVKALLAIDGVEEATASLFFTAFAALHFSISSLISNLL